MPGLFHWQTNYMNIIYNIYSGSEHAVMESTLYHSKNYLGYIQNHKSPFYHKKKVVIQVFNTRATALFYYLFFTRVSAGNPN